MLWRGSTETRKSKQKTVLLCISDEHMLVL